MNAKGEASRERSTCGWSSRDTIGKVCARAPRRLAHFSPRHGRRPSVHGLLRATLRRLLVRIAVHRGQLRRDRQHSAHGRWCLAPGWHALVHEPGRARAAVAVRSDRSALRVAPESLVPVFYGVLSRPRPSVQLGQDAPHARLVAQGVCRYSLRLRAHCWLPPQAVHAPRVDIDPSLHGCPRNARLWPALQRNQ